jgi:flavin-dependent dehydrogenase
MNGKSNSSSRRPGQSETLKRKSVVHDVIIVGGGPAGSVMAWTLAGQGMDVLVLERAGNSGRRKFGGHGRNRGWWSRSGSIVRGLKMYQPQ